MSSITINDSANYELSVIKDPFLKDNITDIRIIMTSKSDGSKYWWATICFKNGNTIGEQRVPSCETFEIVLEGVKQVLNSVKDKL